MNVKTMKDTPRWFTKDEITKIEKIFSYHNGKNSFQEKL